MRYHYEKPDTYDLQYGDTYICNHPVYHRCTLYKIGPRGLAVIQQRYNPRNKTTRWDEIDPWLVDEVYLHKNFENVFNKRSGRCINGLYPTMTIRQLMWAMKMKPIPRERWETCFDRKDI